MLRIFVGTIFLAITTVVSSLEAQQAKVPLPRSAPELQGVSSAGILQFIEAADTTIESFHSVMVVRHGHVVAEGWWGPYDAKTPHQLYSLSKSFTSIAVGLAIEEGKLSVDDEVAQLFADQMPQDPSDNLKSMRVRDLLSMATGHDSEPKVMTEKQWVKAFLSHPIPKKPGTHFMYNTPATYMCSAAVQKKTGQTVADYLQSRLFDPLGFESPTWGKSPEGITLGGYGLNICTEDIAKFGQLCLQKGKWNDRQLVPAAWIEQATSKQISNGADPKSDWSQGYGYQFWRCRNGGYRGDGAFGQYCIVLPEQDAVIAITSGVKNMQAVLDLVWDKLLPAIGKEKLAEDASSVAKLEARLKTLQLPKVAGKTVVELSSKLAGKSFAFDSNGQKIESVEVGKDESKPSLVFTIAGEKVVVPLVNSDWHRQQIRWGADNLQAIATSAAWTGDDVCTIKLCYVETPFIQTLKLKFDSATVSLETESNVSFGPTKQPAIVGKLK